MIHKIKYNYFNEKQSKAQKYIFIEKCTNYQISKKELDKGTYLILSSLYLPQAGKWSRRPSPSGGVPLTEGVLCQKDHIVADLRKNSLWKV